MIGKINNFHSYTKIGGRSRNEDAVLVVPGPETALAIAADGIGGKAGGEVASQTAVASIKKYLENQSVSADLLYDAVMQANEDVLNCVDGQNPRTTIAVLWLDREQALAATVGDTRIYQFRSGGIRFQSIDHTVAQLSVKAGELTEDALRESDERFQLIYALGTDEELRVDLHSLDLRTGDYFLLCTDGFWECINEQEMLEDLASADTDFSWLKAMKTRVKSKQNENSDNYSAIVVSVS